MPIVIKPKRSETASSIPSTSDLAVGELGMNTADQKYIPKIQVMLLLRLPIVVLQKQLLLIMQLL